MILLHIVYEKGIKAFVPIFIYLVKMHLVFLPEVYIEEPNFVFIYFFHQNKCISTSIQSLLVAQSYQSTTIKFKIFKVQLLFALVSTLIYIFGFLTFNFWFPIV